MVEADCFSLVTSWGGGGFNLGKDLQFSGREKNIDDVLLSVWFELLICLVEMFMKS
jgi:hypothetical protein